MQPEGQKSIAERARRVTRQGRVPPLWEDGRFAANPDWLPQNVKNVEVVASDGAGNRLAIEHTSIHAFEHHQREEKWIRQIGLTIEAAAELQFPGRRFFITFNRDVFDDLSARKRGEYTKELISWLAETFPDLPMGIHRLTTPSLLPKKKPNEIAIEVDEFLDGLPRTSVGGMLPQDATKRAAPQVEQALKSKLPKLSDAPANRKVLLVELPTLDTSPSLIIGLIENSSNYAEQLRRIDFVVLAKTHKDQVTGTAWFFAYETLTYKLGDVGYVRW